MSERNYVHQTSQSSVTFEQTTRGPTWCVKVYADAPEEAFAKALDLFQRARRELSPPPAQEAPGAPLASP